MIRSNTGLFAALGVALATSLAPEVHAQGSSIALLDYRTIAPAGWVARTPSSSSRLAQFLISGQDSASSAEVVVYSFGNMPGNVEANLARWKSQFSAPDGSPVPMNVTRDSSGAFPITIAEYRGTYRRGIGDGSADSVRTGHSLVSAIVETPRGALFAQLFGPSARVVTERDAFVRFVKGIK